MAFIDWTIIFAVMGVLFVIAFVAKQYTRSVSDFLVANRCAGRYLLSLSEGASGLGLISFIAYWQMYYEAGFSALWWSAIMLPVGLFITLSGFVVYRLRQTRVMTIAQFFEVRYSRKFRVYTGFIAWISGIVNYGIFPAVTARALIYFCGFPVYTANVGPLELNLTMGVVMLIMLSMAVIFTNAGGQISVMITDFFQGQFFNISFLILLIFIISKMNWGHTVEILKQAPEGKSMLDPFDQGKIPNFNIWYFLIGAFMAFYGVRAWQGSQAYTVCATSPHEQKMATVLGAWRKIMQSVMFVVAPLLVYVVMHSPQFTGLAEQIRGLLGAIADENIRERMITPVGLSQILPVGMVGLLGASFVAAAVSTDDTYLHSWGSIFIQDVVMPLRKKPFKPAQHIKWLRWSIVGVAAFAWLFGMLFPLREAILMFFMITGAIYLGGAGAVIIGGLYWKRATTAGAWVGMSVGSFLAISVIVVRNFLWSHLGDFQMAHPDWQWLQALPEKFPLNSAQCSFWAAIIAVASYVITSLLTKPDPDFDMDRMLHRGKYTIKDETKIIKEPTIKEKLIGITHEFTTGDKIIWLTVFGLNMFTLVAFIIGTPLYLIFGATDDTWAKWWLFRMGLTGVMAIITTVWFLWGGTRDLFDLFRRLKTAIRDDRDDGSVIGHHNVADAGPEEEEDKEDAGDAV